MKRIVHIVLNTFKTISCNRLNSVLIFSVLIVSFMCSLFTLAMGNAEMRKKEENSVDARSLKLEISGTDKEKFKPIFEELNGLYELNSFMLTAETTETVKEYSSEGVKETVKTSLIATDLFELEDNFNWYFALPREIESGHMIFTGNEYSKALTSEPKFLDGRAFKVEDADASHRFFENERGSDDMYFLNSEDFFYIAKNYTRICILFKETPDETVIENTLNIICSSVEPTDVVLPRAPSGMQVERSKLFCAAVLLLLSFINIKSAFIFLCSKRKNEYKIYRIYGATKAFISFDILGMILIFSLVSFAVSGLLYLLLYPILLRLGVDYPINLFTVGLLLVTVILMSCFSALSCIREVKSMKLFREAYKLLASDALKSILLILQTAGFIILFNISLGTVNTAKFLANKVEDTNLKFSYYYSYGQAGIQNDHDGKELIDIAVPKYFCPSYKSTLITAYCFSDDFLKENELCMKNGGRVSSLSNNECVISYDFAKAMKIKKGDTVELLYNELPVKLLVKGILHRDEQIIKFTVSGNDLSLKSIYEKPKSAIIFTSCTAVDMSEMETFPCGIYKNKDNYTQKEIEDIYGEYGEIASFESMLNEEKEENKSIVMFFNSLAVVLLIVTFINVTANNFLILEFQEKRFGIYYLYGMSFSGIFRITFIRNLIMIGVSCIIGLGILSYIRRFSYIDEFSFNISSLICSIGIVALLTFMSEIPLHLKMKRTEPIRFFAEGLE